MLPGREPLGRATMQVSLADRVSVLKDVFLKLAN
jgi:hypothetical protein